jgi:hypothetical protein
MHLRVYWVRSGHQRSFVDVISLPLVSHIRFSQVIMHASSTTYITDMEKVKMNEEAMPHSPNRPIAAIQSHTSIEMLRM